jgi:hypothetical protein
VLAALRENLTDVLRAARREKVTPAIMASSDLGRGLVITMMLGALFWTVVGFAVWWWW